MSKDELIKAIDFLHSEKGLTYKGLASILQVSPKAVQNYAYGRNKIGSEATLKRLRSLLDKHAHTTAAQPVEAPVAQPVEAPVAQHSVSNRVAKSDKNENSPEALQALQRRLGKTGHEMAELLGVSVSTWMSWRTGTKIPTREKSRKALQRVRNASKQDIDNAVNALAVPSKETQRALTLVAEFRQQQTVASIRLAAQMSAKAHGFSETEYIRSLRTFTELVVGYLTLEELHQSLRG